MIKIPFGDYEDFADCISKNQDKDNPEGYCAALHKKITGKWPSESKLAESFGWASEFEILKPYNKLIRGKAIHPIKTYHADEWPNVRVYLEEELEQSAKNMIGKPLFLDHWKPLKGSVYGAHYEDGALEYIASLEDEDVLRMIRDGEIKHASVQFEWKVLEQVNGIAPRGINYQHLSLLKELPPGDVQSTVEIWESIIHEAKSHQPNPTITENEVGGPPRQTEEWIRDRQMDPEHCEPGSYKTGEEKDGVKIIYCIDKRDGQLKPQSIMKRKSKEGRDVPPAKISQTVINMQENERPPKDWWDSCQGKATGFADDPDRFCGWLWASGPENLRIAFGEAKITPVSMEEALKAFSEQQEPPQCPEGQKWDPEKRECVPVPPTELGEAKKTIEALKGQIQVLTDQKTALEEGLKAQIEILTNQKNALQEELNKAKKVGEAIISSDVTPPPNMIDKAEVAKRLKEAVFERVPQHWGYGPHEQNRKIKQLIKELEGI